ncbi:45581_t:CDS:2, partial [Gigaspora margarita]
RLDQETSNEQMAVDTETNKENLPKTPMELNSYGTQNEITGSNAITIINRKRFSSLGDNVHFEKIKHNKNSVSNLKEKEKIEIESNKVHSKASSSEKVPQINVLLQEILKKLETVESNQLVLLVTDKVNISIRGLAHLCS